MTTLIDFDLTEDGDIQFDTGGDIALTTNEDALKQQTVLDTHDVIEDFDLRSDRAALKNLQSSIEERLMERGYNDLVDVRVESVQGTTVSLSGTIAQDESWTFDVESV